MEKYECSFCQFSTTLRANYNRHLTTKKHKINAQSNPNITKCKNKNGMKELTDLLKLQIELQQKQIENQTKQLELQQTQINNIQINHIHYNLLPYQHTDTSHLTDEDFIQCVNQPNCVKHLIEKIHFNPTKPENMNVYISNLKDEFMMVYNGKWKSVHKKLLDDLFRNKHYMIEDWIQTDKYPELKKLFDIYLTQKEDDETLNQMKEEIKLMLYNQKDTVRRLTE
jgi:hypothetical protein